MNTRTNLSFDKNDLLSLIATSQRHIETLTNLLSVSNALDSSSTPLTSDPIVSPEELIELEDKVSKISMSFESDSSILLKHSDKPAVEYSCEQMGFRSQETKTWKMLIEILCFEPHTFSFGSAYIYPDGGREKRYKCKDYDARWKLYDELNKKLLVFFKREFGWNFPAGYKLYESLAEKSDREKSFKFSVNPPLLQTNTTAVGGEGSLMADIEKQFLSLNESDLVLKIEMLNGDDISIDSSEPPENLVAAINVGKEKFEWSDDTVMKLICT